MDAPFLAGHMCYTYHIILRQTVMIASFHYINNNNINHYPTYYLHLLRQRVWPYQHLRLSTSLKIHM